MGKAERPAPSRAVMDGHPPYFMEMELTRHVASGELGNALAVLGQINAYQRSVLARDAERSLKNSLICNCTFLARAAIEGGVPYCLAFRKSDELIFRMEEMRGMDELRALEREHVESFVGLVRESQCRRYSKHVRRAMRHVCDNLGEELGLRALAEAVGLNPNYLSSLFRRETGIRLSEYVMRKRLRDAKFLLCHTDSTISEIAHYYRFASQSHFTKRFLEYSGMTPLTYRKSLGGAKGGGPGEAPAGGLPHTRNGKHLPNSNQCFPS